MRDEVLIQQVQRAQAGDQRAMDYVLGRALALDELRVRAEDLLRRAEAQLEGSAGKLSDAQAANRKLQEEHARAFYLDGSKMYDLSASLHRYIDKARSEGKSPSEAVGVAFGQVLAELGYSSPGSERG